MSTIASHLPLNISETVSDRPRGLVVWFQRTINRIWPAVTVGSRRCGLPKSLTSCAGYGRLSGHCLKMRVKHWSRRSSPVACNYVFSVEPVAVGSECYRLSGYWYSALYRHDAVAVSATLATGTPSRRLQA